MKDPWMVFGLVKSFPSTGVAKGLEVLPTRTLHLPAVKEFLHDMTLSEPSRNPCLCLPFLLSDP